MVLTKEHINIFHEQNSRAIKLVFYIVAFATVLGYGTDTFLTLRNNEIISATLNIFQVTITLTSVVLLLFSVFNVRQSSALFIYSQLFVETCAIFYYVATNNLEEKRYVVEFFLHLVYMMMIGYLSSPKQSLYFGILPLLICIILNILYVSDPRFSFMPVYIPILGAFPIGCYFLIKNMYASFSNNYLSKIKIQKQAKNIEQQNKEIKRLNQFQKDLAAMIVHDLKNPLNIILSKIDNTIVQRSGKGMLNLIQNLLDVEKYSDTEIQLNREVFSIADELQFIFSDMSVLAEEKNIIFQYLGEDFYVYADKQMINRILENLLTNALKYSAINSQIDVKVYEYSKEKIKVEVINYGMHIPADKLETIFDKYSQVNPGKSSIRYGSGLGLTFCKIALNAHDQEICAKNIAGGVSFEFTLNMKNASAIKQTFRTRDVLKLSPFERTALIQYVNTLKNFPVDSATEILSVLDSIEVASENINNWKLKLKTAVFSANEQLYLSLLTMVEE